LSKNLDSYRFAQMSLYTVYSDSLCSITGHFRQANSSCFYLMLRQSDDVDVVFVSGLSHSEVGRRRPSRAVVEFEQLLPLSANLPKNKHFHTSLMFEGNSRNPATECKNSKVCRRLLQYYLNGK
jgi:hypothetical protein